MTNLILHRGSHLMRVHLIPTTLRIEEVKRKKKKELRTAKPNTTIEVTAKTNNHVGPHLDTPARNISHTLLCYCLGAENLQILNESKTERKICRPALSCLVNFRFLQVVTCSADVTGSGVGRGRALVFPSHAAQLKAQITETERVQLGY